MNHNEDSSSNDINFEAQNMAEKDEINGPISLEEIKTAVKNLKKKKKSNGLDMILNEHCHRFKNYMSDCLISFLIHALSRKPGPLGK